MELLNGAYEVRDGLLTVGGRPVPLSKGLVLLALLRAGWKGAEGFLPPEVALRLPLADPRIGVYVRPLPRAG